MRLGLRSKIIVIAVGMTLAALGAILAISGHLFGSAYQAALLSRSTAIAKGLGFQLERILQLGIQLDSLSGFDKQCREAVHTYEGIDMALVADLDGRVLFSSRGDGESARLPDERLRQAIREGGEKSVEYIDGGIRGYAAVLPVRGPDAVPVGSVVVGLSARLIEDSLRDMQLGVLGIGLLALLAGVLLQIASVTRFVTRPLGVVIDSIERLRSGSSDLSGRVAIDSSDELGNLARAFNALMEKLQATTVSKSSLESAYAALQTSEAKYRELVTNADAIILRVRCDGTIEYFNEYAERFFGYARGEVLGRPIVGTIVPPRDSETGRDLGQLVAEVLAHPQRHALLENENMTRDGRRVYVRWSNRMIDDGQGAYCGLLSIGQDITEKRLAEKELERYRQNLEKLVEERTKALSVAKETAEAASRAKSVFLANMSHELRTPMNAIIGITALALRRAAEPKLVDQLGKIEQASRHLLAVINDILDISKIEAERLRLEEVVFCLGEVIDRLAGLIDVKAAEKGLVLAIELPAEMKGMLLRGDPVRLEQVLLNLCGNAVKFTEAGTITLRVRLVAEGAGGLMLRFDVVDTGIGIPEADRSRIFSAFEQADSSMTRRYGGTGLGLAISRQLVRLMGGEIGVESPPGAGSDFWFTARFARAAALPEAAAGNPAETPESCLRRLFTGAGVLLVEDEPINQEVAGELLAGAGLAVDSAADGDEACRMARARRYDHHPDGHADAADERDRSHRPHPPAGPQHRHAHRRHDRQRLRRGPPGLPGRGHGRPCRQTRRSGCPLPDPVQMAVSPPGQRGRSGRR